MMSSGKPLKIHNPEIIDRLGYVRREMMSDFSECDIMIEALLCECFILLMRSCLSNVMDNPIMKTVISAKTGSKR